MWKFLLLLTLHLAGHFVPLAAGDCRVHPVGDSLVNADVVGRFLGDCGGELGIESTLGKLMHEGYHSTILTENFELVTVASEKSDGYQRFARSADVFGIPVTTLGLGEPWRGGDMLSVGGGYKINLLKKYVEQFKDNKDKVIMFTDSFDVIILSGAEKILSTFEFFDCRVVFSAEGFCWPDRTLASKYPTAPRGKRYLNSGGFIGYAPEIFKILNSSVVKDKDDDQLFYTNVYLDEKLRIKYNIKLDHKSEIFQNLNGAIDDVELRFNEEEEAYLHNKALGTDPLVVHGNGPTKLVLNTLGSYLAKAWNSKDGCITCWDDIINLQEKDEKTFPVVLIAIFIEHPTAFLEEFLNKIYDLNYPKKKLHLFVHNAVEYHAATVDSFLKKHEAEYRSLKRVNPEDDVKDPKARALALDYCKTKKCDYYFNIDSEAHVDNPHTLKLLVEQNRTIIAPVLVRPYKLWSNFWGAMTADGFYARSVDYMQIIHNERRGVWNVPYIRSCYLLNATLINHKQLRPSYEHESLDSDMAFCNNVRDKNIFMYVSNRFDYGHLVDNDNFDITKTNPEVYQIFDNRWDWEQRYIHKNYTENLNPNTTIEQFKPETCSSDVPQTSASQMSLETKAGAQPCPDVYWFPIVTERFCKEFIEIVEGFGKWSDGSNKDERLDGGYENVPTRDIHMKQVDLDPQWMEFLRLYIRPLQELVFTGYYHNPPRSLMNFVVRYRPDEQPSLRPHHDSSTYTINLALNRPNIDFEGGGCRFIRYNCSVTNTRVGWLLMHPGRLTHYHEGLQVTSGTRYIMISFVDP